MTTRSANITALLFAFPLGACGGGTKLDVDAAARGVAVRVAHAETRTLEDSVVLTGTLRPRAQVQVVAEVSARLLRVVRDEGSRVAQGDILATLDPTDYRLSNDRARAALEVAEANRSHARAEKERADSLLKSGGITDKDRLAAEVGLQVADASFSQVRAETAIAAQQLARTDVRAPFSGRVAKRFVDAGAMLVPGTPLVILVDDAVLEFRSSVPSTDYGKVKVGAQVDLVVDALADQKVKGKVARITPLVEERTRSFEVVVEVPGGGNLVGGLFARAMVRVGTVEGAIVVPPSALVRDGANPEAADIFVVENGKAVRKTVVLGVETADAIQVKSGLVAGADVVLDPPTALGSGSPIVVQNGTSGNGKAK